MSLSLADGVVLLSRGVAFLVNAVFVYVLVGRLRRLEAKARVEPVYLPPREARGGAYQPNGGPHVHEADDPHEREMRAAFFQWSNPEDIDDEVKAYRQRMRMGLK